MTVHDEVPVFSKLPPPDLAAPVGLVGIVRAKSRSNYILDHGFTPQDVEPGWWTRQGAEIGFPSTVDGVAKLTRRDLFEMADGVSTGGGNELLPFVWHVLAWGSGDSRRNNLRRIQSCRTEAELLRRAFDAARKGDRRGAYGLLIRPGGAVIPWFGPAFFSKFLYFASGEASPACLILDARVARAMYPTWKMAPTYPTRTFSYNWYTDTYVAYCELLTRWAQEAGGSATADMFERALFEFGKR